MSEQSEINSSPNIKQTKDKQTNKKRLITIDFFSQNPTNNPRITSPRSLFAIKNSGYSLEELFYITFDQYKQLYPEIIPLSQERQKKRYEFYENHRKEKISIISNLRLTIKDTEESNNNNSNSYSKSTQIKKSKSHIANNELTTSDYLNTNNGIPNSINKANSNERELNKMIAKNELDLINMIRCSIQNEKLIKDAEEKQRIELEKKEKYQQELQKHREEEEKKWKAKKEEIQRRLDEEETQRQLRENEKAHLEHQKEIEKGEKEQQHQAEIARKQKEEELKRKNIQEKMNQIKEENNIKIEEKLKDQEQKEKERQKNIEEKRIHLLLQSLRKSQQKKEVIQFNQKKAEKQIEDIQNKIIEKQKQNEIKKKRYEEERQTLIKSKQNQSRIKAEEIQKIIEKNEEIEKQRVIDYNKKQKEIQTKLVQLQQEEREEKEKRRIRQLEKEYCIKDNLNKREGKSHEKNIKIIEKICKREEYAKQIEYNRSKENILKSDDQYQHQILKKEKIRIIAKKQEIEREKIFDEIAHKTLQVDQFLQKKRLFVEKKLKFQADISKKKEEYTEKFQSLMNKKSIDDKTLRIMKKMFPNNLEIDDLILNLNSKTNGYNKKRMKYGHLNRLVRNNSQSNRGVVVVSNPNNSQEYFKSEENRNELPLVKKDKSTIEINCIRSNINNNNKQMTDKEIIEKVNQYKEKLNQDLLKIVAYEREQEETRENILNKLKTLKEKEEMDKEFGIKRAEASKSILLKNE